MSCTDQCIAPFVKSIDENGILFCESPCSRRDFIYSDGLCDQSCSTPLFAVFDASFKFCKNPCNVTTQYLYWNRSCSESCPALLKIESKPGVNYCVNPCQVSSSYLYSDGSCGLNCHWPMKIKIEFRLTYCLPPCDLAREYILIDGSCSAECPLPLVQKTEAHAGTYCLSPCESQDHFVLNNGSCRMDCPVPFKESLDFGIKHCVNPCLLHEYYYPQNKSCLDQCPSPFLARDDDGVKFCNGPCPEMTSPFYYLVDHLCYNNCPPSLLSKKSDGVWYCWSHCNRSEYLSEDGTCQENCQYPENIIQKGPYQRCLRNANITQERQGVNALTFISEVGGIVECFLNGGRDPTSILMMPLLNIFGKTELSLNRQRRDIENLFDYNLGKMVIICLITLLLEGVSRVMRHPEMLKKWSVALKWNILAPVFISTIGNVMIYFFVSVQERQSWTHIFKSQRMLIFFTMIIPSMILILFTIIKISLEMNRLRGDFQRWRFIFEVYRFDSIYQRLFLVVYLVRVILVSIIIARLENFPRIQAIFLILISVGILTYLIRVSPIRNRISYLQHMIIETILLFYNVLLVVLATVNSERGEGLKNNLGHLLNILYGGTLILTGIIIVMKLLCHLYSLLFKGTQTGHIQLREFSQNSEEEAAIESSEQQAVVEIGEEGQMSQGRYFFFWRTNFYILDSDENAIEADVVIN